MHFLIWPGILLLLEKQIVSAACLESRTSYTLPTCPVSVLPGSASCCGTFLFSSPWVGPSSPAFLLTSPTDWWPSTWRPAHSSPLSPKMSKYVHSFLPNILPYKNKCPTICWKDSCFHNHCNLNIQERFNFEEAKHRRYENRSQNLNSQV